MKKVHTTIRLCPDLHNEIVKIAKKENRKVSNVIETALKKVIKIEKT